MDSCWTFGVLKYFRIIKSILLVEDFYFLQTVLWSLSCLSVTVTVWWQTLHFLTCVQKWLHQLSEETSISSIFFICVTSPLPVQVFCNSSCICCTCPFILESSVSYRITKTGKHFPVSVAASWPRCAVSLREVLGSGQSCCSQIKQGLSMLLCESRQTD